MMQKKPIKNTPGFKALKRTPKEKARLQDLGIGEVDVKVPRPDHVPKVVTATKCDLCGQPLPDGTVVCFRCGNCVFCGSYSQDRYANSCLACGNDAPGRTDETDVVFTADAIHHHTDR